MTMKGSSGSLGSFSQKKKNTIESTRKRKSLRERGRRKGARVR